VLPGFPWFQADDNFTTPALADVLGDGHLQIVEGGDQTGNSHVIFGTIYKQGGHMRVLRQTGNYAQRYPNGGLLCEKLTDQTMPSSPAVGRFSGGGVVGAVFGTGTGWRGASMSNKVLAMNAANCASLWSRTLDGSTIAGPALANVLGDGRLHVVQGTRRADRLGSVWVLNGANGATIWRRTVRAGVIGSVVTADLSGQGDEDVIVATSAGVEVFDGKTGTDYGTLPGTRYQGFQNSPLVTRDPGGKIGITVAGYNGLNQGVITHYEVAGSNGARVGRKGSWPVFHHDSQLTGNAGTPAPVVAIATRASGQGYWLAQTDAGVYTCTSSCSGPSGVLALNSLIVAMATTPDAGGYWRVGGDGGIFTAGNANYYGSMGGHHLNRPIVGMAATHSGHGYWEVASDGGIFTFGDAKYLGSMGGRHLNKPIVAMAATQSGKGYFLVASDGGIFTFGDAVFRGSTGAIHLNKPILGMAPRPTGKGYWLFASDGGIFTFGDAVFRGSAGGLHLSRPIVGMAVTGSGKGYWLAGADGRVFNFGDATSHGSIS
jgi:hypothetical protein